MDKCSSGCQGDLKVRIKELEEVVKQIMKEKEDEELMAFPWVGNLGQWYWMVQSNEVEFNNRKVTNLGYSIEELPGEIGFEFFTDKLHPDDYERVMENMRSHLMNKSEAYEVEYRIKAKDGNYVWYYDRGKVTKRDEDGKPVLLSGIVFDINKSKMMESELKEANEKLKLMVVTDELTGAYNRRFMLEKMQEEMNRFKRTGSGFSLVMMDVDRFKHINDSCGHNSGDIVLKKLADKVNGRIRKTDVFCRWGGDEFMVLLPDTEMNDALKLAEGIRAKIAGIKLESGIDVTASLGVSNFIDGDTLDSFVKRADDAMYMAKDEGGNCVK